MGTIYSPTTRPIRVLQGEKTSFPILRKLAAGETAASHNQGSWVGASVSGGEEVALKVTSGNEAAQAKNALLVISNTTNDANESGAISCLQGLFRLETTKYKNDDTYAAGDRLTVRAVGGEGVLAKKDGGNTTHWVAQVLVPPTNASANTPMTVLVFGFASGTE